MDEQRKNNMTAEADGIIASGTGMKDHIDAAISAVGRDFLGSGNHDPPCEDAVCCRQRAGDHRASAKISHQLVSAEAHTASRCHDDTADIAERRIKIDDERIFSCAERLKKRQLLLAHDSGDTLFVHQRKNRLTVFGTRRLQIADLVERDPGIIGCKT